MRKLAGISLAALLLLSISGGSASALVITPNPIPLIGTGKLGSSIVASIELVDSVLGIPIGGVVSFGAIAPSDLSLVFRISVDSSSDPVAVFGVGAATSAVAFPLLPLSGAGVIPGPDANISLFYISPDPSVAITGASLLPGTQSDLFFVAYSTPPGVGEVVRVAADDTLIAPFCDNGFCVQNYGTVVPEPASSELLEVGLIGLALLQRSVRS